MARPKRLIHRHYVRHDADTQELLQKISAVIQQPPAVTLRLAYMQMLEALADLPEKEVRDAFSIKDQAE